MKSAVLRYGNLAFFLKLSFSLTVKMTSKGKRGFHRLELVQRSHYNPCPRFSLSMIDKMIIMIKWSPDLRSAASDGLTAQFVWRQSPERSAGPYITRILTQGASDGPDQSEASLVTRRRPIRSQDNPWGLTLFHVWTTTKQQPSSAVRRSSGCRYRGQG